MIAESDFKRAYKSEKLYSGKFGKFGVEIRIAIDRPFVNEDNFIMYEIADKLEDVLMRRTVMSDPEEIAKKKEEHDKLMACFPEGMAILAEELPNGYCPRWCCSMRPWYRVTTQYGIFTIGWRKRVIEISWDAKVASTADVMFPDETSTKFDHTIHAWDYEKAKQYIKRLTVGE